jgi:hypothetical protein
MKYENPFELLVVQTLTIFTSPNFSFSYVHIVFAISFQDKGFLTVAVDTRLPFSSLYCLGCISSSILSN